MIKKERRAINSLIYVGLILVVLGGYLASRAWMIKNGGGQTDGVVTSKRTRSHSGGPGNRYPRTVTYEVNYTYKVNGVQMSGSTSLAHDKYDSLVVGDTLPITYEESDAGTSSADPQYELVVSLGMMGFGLALLIWGTVSKSNAQAGGNWG